MRRKRNRHRVIRSPGRPPVMLRMKLDSHRRRIHDYAQVAIVRRVVVLQRQRVIDFVRRPIRTPHRRKRRVPTAPRHEKWNLHRSHRQRKTLVVMRMAGKDRMRPHPRRRAGRIDIRQHQRAAAVLFAPSERRMMHRNNHRR